MYLLDWRIGPSDPSNAEIWDQVKTFILGGTYHQEAYELFLLLVDGDGFGDVPGNNPTSDQQTALHTFLRWVSMALEASCPIELEFLRPIRSRKLGQVYRRIGVFVNRRRYDWVDSAHNKK
jgi:hypothetical protein